jgi:SAM-dependent methyltransferase
VAIFSEAYANYYDQLHADKDYVGECDLIEEAFRRFGTSQIHKVVDLGCGTGNHSIPLAQRGYSVTGVDLSAQMLRLARRKANLAHVKVKWIKGDICNVYAGGPFGAGLLMFSVLGYFLSNEDVLAALGNVRRHIRLGGLLAFDFWYGPAVLTIRPSDRIKIITLDDGKVIRTATARLSSRHHICEVHYHLWQLNGNRVMAEREELHTVRYFFPMELELMLSQSGFSLTSLTAFPTLNRAADESTWNAFGVASAI